MDSDQLVYVSNWFSSQSSIIFQAYQVELLSSNVHKNKKKSLICEILIFDTPELSSSLEASNNLQLCAQWSLIA